MPSSYSASARYTLQATGENNNTWGVILNNGVFKLVDDNINGRLAFALSTTKTLTTALGATDEARNAFLDITGGIGGAVVIPAVPKGYFIRNASAGLVSITTGGPGPCALGPGDAGPVFTDGSAVYPIMLAGLSLIDYISAAIISGGATFPPAVGNLGKVLIVRMAGFPLAPTWVPDFLQVTDVSGLDAALATIEDKAVAWALTL
jgi:hypothetical protein